MDTDTHVECPICYKCVTTALSICKNRHYVCLECIESMLCHRTVLTTVMDIRVWTERRTQTCPVCRCGYLTYSGRTGLTTSTLNILEYPDKQLGHYWSGDCDIFNAPGSVTFRGVRYPNRLKAVSAWSKKPLMCYECECCDKSIRQTVDMPWSYVIEAIGAECTVCTVCWAILTSDEICYHFAKQHYLLFDAEIPIGDRRRSRRIADQRIRREIDELRHDQ